MARRRRRRRNPSSNDLFKAGVFVAAGYGVLKLAESIGLVDIGTPPDGTPPVSKTSDSGGYCTPSRFTGQVPNNRAWCESEGGTWKIGSPAEPLSM